MARAFVQDLWLVKHDQEGRPTPSAVKRTLASARDPLGARIPEKWKTERFGRGKRWRVSWSVVDPETGKRSMKSKAFERYSDAEAFQAAVEDDLRSGRYVTPVDPHSFSEAAQGWLESNKLRVKPSTRHLYSASINAYVLPVFGDAPIQTITPAQAQSWVAGLKSGSYKGLTFRNGGLARNTINHALLTAKGTMDWAIQAGWRTGENPFGGLKLSAASDVQEESADKIFLSPAQVESIARAISAQRGERDKDVTLLWFLALTGVRIGEATALKIKDVDLDSLRATISKTWSINEKGMPTLSTPKSGRTRKVAFPPSLKPRLEKLIGVRGADAWLFEALHGGAVRSADWRRRVFAPALKEAHLDGQGITVHSLRHTFASWAIASGADVKTVQTQLGHAKASMTLDVYANLWPDKLSEVSLAVDSMVSSQLLSAENDEKMQATYTHSYRG